MFTINFERRTRTTKRTKIKKPITSAAKIVNATKIINMYQCETLIDKIIIECEKQ